MLPSEYSAESPRRVRKMSSIYDSIGVVYGDHGNESQIGETIMQSDKGAEIDNGKDKKYSKEKEN